LDGKVDLYVSGYHPFGRKELRMDPVYPALSSNTEEGEPNLLYRNEIEESGSWTFADVTEAAGLDQNNRGMTSGAAFEDYDADGDADLYVANDFGRNLLFRNEGDGTFVEVSETTGTGDSSFGMSATWGDANRDGLPDLYLSNMWSSAGQRVTTQSIFKPELGEKGRRGYLQLALGNTMLLNVDGQTFEDISMDAGVTMGRWAWASPYIDYNNDGWEDLFVANGFFTAPGPGDL
ncbi:MAG: VCBS repeat-containing protein, partial [Verrucomicrobiota bacterium]